MQVPTLNLDNANIYKGRKKQESENIAAGNNISKEQSDN